MRWSKDVTIFMTVALLAAPASAQQMIFYPAHGQSPEKQNYDRYECSNWATGQTGFNPEQAYAPPPSMPGGAFRGAFGGAALGAVGGAIGGNAGEGAAIGAAVGGLFGGMRRMAAENTYAQQQSSLINAYNQALAACMQGRGYAVG